ncbi:MAG TPA: hypothetical protein VF003_06270 [Pseudonocardiaceae bacterium]
MRGAELLIRARDRKLLITSGLWTVPIVLFRTLESRLSPLRGKASSTTDVVQAAGMRVLDWIQGSVVGSIFTLVPAVLLAVWARRRRLLDEPQPHRRFFQRVAVLGVALAAAVGFGESLVVAPVRGGGRDRGAGANPDRIRRRVGLRRDSPGSSRSACNSVTAPGR